MRKPRLFWQLYPYWVAIALASIAVVTGYASHSQRQFFLEQTRVDLEARARLFELRVIPQLDPLNKDGVDALCKEVGRATPTRVTVILPSGEVVGDSEKDPSRMDTHVDRSEVLDALAEGAGTSIRHSRTVGKRFMYTAMPVRSDGRTLAVIRTSIPIETIDRAVQGFQVRMLAAGLVMAAVVAGLSLLVSRRITRPIEQLKQWAESIPGAKGRLRAPPAHSAELEALSRSMEHMAAELRERIDTIMRQRNEMEAVLSSMLEGVIAVDKDERVISLNRASGEIFQADSRQAPGRSIQEVVRNTTLQEFVRKVLSGQGPLEQDMVIHSGGERYLNGHGTPLRDPQGRQIGALIVLNDVTRLRRLENMRREFVANVSHELRTPITTIKGFVETLRSGDVDSSEDADRFLEIIAKHMDRLGAIIEDLLSLSRLEQETDRQEIPFSDERLRPVLESAVQACASPVGAKNITIDLVCETDLAARINGPLLEQAVVNLLDNGVKFSREGSRIGLRAEKKGQEISISVADQGTGIGKEHLPRLFERFYRADNGRSRELGGTGLGLAIVKHVAQVHGGRVSVESTVGEGSVFSIHLPA